MVPRLVRPFMVPSFYFYIRKEVNNMNVQEICNQIKEKLDSVKTIQELNNIKVIAKLERVEITL